MREPARPKTGDNRGQAKLDDGGDEGQWEEKASPEGKKPKDKR